MPKLTKREYFALQILAAMATQPNKYLPSVNDAVSLADRLIAKLTLGAADYE
jgi:hypothetical protein